MRVLGRLLPDCVSGVYAEGGKVLLPEQQDLLPQPVRPFLCQFFKDQMASVLPFTNIVFGNETEAASYAEVNRFLKTEIRDLSKFSIFIFNVLILFVTQVSSLGITDVGEIGKKIAMLPKENGSTSRLVIITQASDPVIVVQHGKA